MPSSTLMHSAAGAPARLAPALAALLVLAVALARLPRRRLGRARLGARRGALGGHPRRLAPLRPRAQGREPETAASGLRAFELVFKALVVLVVLVAVAATNADLALPAILVFALAYTAELGLSLATYFGSEK